MSNQQQMFDYAFDEARRMIEVAVCEASREETDQKAWWKRAMDLMSLSRDLASSIDEAEMFSEDGDTDTDDDDDDDEGEGEGEDTDDEMPELVDVETSA